MSHDVLEQLVSLGFGMFLGAFAMWIFLSAKEIRDDNNRDR